MIKEYKIKSKDNQPSFIGGWIMDEKICDGLIDFFNNDKTIKINRGCIGSIGNVDTSRKDSYDKTIPPNYNDDGILSYCTELQKCIEAYCQKYEYAHAAHSTSWTMTEDMMLQYYKPGGGYKIFHFENEGNLHIYRHLVFMTYLNDVPGGGTEFLYQNLITPAIKGLTLIWPAIWTHTHRGQISKNYEKYIATGWFNFIK